MDTKWMTSAANVLSCNIMNGGWDRFQEQPSGVSSLAPICNNNPISTGAHFTNAFYHHNSNSMKILFYTHLNSINVITTNFCTCHDSCAVMACAKLCCYLMSSNWITARKSFHRISIVSKWNKPLDVINRIINHEEGLTLSQLHYKKPKKTSKCISPFLPSKIKWISECTSCGRMLVNYANPVYGVATICHQVCWLRWGHPSLFYIATPLLIWYKMFCVREISYRLIWMEFINTFSVYAQSGTHSRF